MTLKVDTSAVLLQEIPSALSKGLVYSFPQKSKEAAGCFLVTCRRKDKKAQSKELIT